MKKMKCNCRKNPLVICYYHLIENAVKETAESARKHKMRPSFQVKTVMNKLVQPNFKRI